MSLEPAAIQDHRQGRLLALAGVFLGVYALALTLSPAVRARSWEVPYRWAHWLAFGLWVLLFAMAHRYTRRWLPDRDPYLLPIAGMLTGWGLLSVWRLYPDFGVRQTGWLLAGLAIYFAGLRLPADLRFLRRYKYIWLTGGLLLTALTLIFGANPLGYGPRLWLGCCGFYIQPSEPLKLLLIVYLASYLADQILLPVALQGRFGSLGSGGKKSPALIGTDLLPFLAPTLLMTGIALLLLLAQRDLGTASIFLFLYTVIVYIATGSKRIVVFGAVSMLLAGAAGYALFDVVRVRIDAWLNPWLDPSGRSYQIVQSLIAVANGGLVGRGPGLGNPSLVPVPHSDFIFASITEETGLLGALALILIYALLAGRGLRIALGARDAYRRYLAAGLTAYLVGQSALIIGGNLRLLPLTGVTLPFVSYGGSSLVTSFISLLLLTLISSQVEDRPVFIPSTRPYLHLGAFLLVGLGAAAVVASWWTVFRGSDLLARTDNPRAAIADRDVPRGMILDRNDSPLVDTVGQPGGYTRLVLYPPLSPVLGYSDPVYGQAGLEASMDAYLRGQRGNSGLAIWWDHLLYGEHPPGLSTRLSLDLYLQKAADEAMGGSVGSLVLMHADTGEILAMTSHPSYDANRIGQDWNTLVSDPLSPLLNRATQGMYAPGPAVMPLLLASVDSQRTLPGLPTSLGYTLRGIEMQCAFPVEDGNWNAAAQNGCPGAATLLGKSLGDAPLMQLYDNFGLFSAPQIRLPTSSAPRPAAATDPAAAALGESIRVSPLQMAIASSALSAKGILPAPRLVSSVNTPQSGWIMLPALAESRQAVSPALAAQAARTLTTADSLVWHTVATAPNGMQGNTVRMVTWYLGGSTPDYQGTPLALALVLEEENPALAQEIGQALLLKAMQP